MVRVSMVNYQPSFWRIIVNNNERRKKGDDDEYGYSAREQYCTNT